MEANLIQEFTMLTVMEDFSDVPEFYDRPAEVENIDTAHARIVNMIDIRKQEAFNKLELTFA